MSLESLPTHLQDLAVKAAYKMSEAFDVDFEHFAVVYSDPNPRILTPTVAYCARLGLYEGNWNDIVGSKRSPAPKEDFVIEVDGVEFDSRQGMTEGVYRAMVSQNANDFSPDSPIRNMGRRSVSFPMTWLTGESATPHWSPLGSVSIRDGRKAADRVGLRRNSQVGMARFRPAVPLGQVSVEF